MGFRISLYRVPTIEVEKLRDTTDETWESSYEVLSNDMIKYDTLTDIIMSDKEDKFSSRLFKNKLEIECDMSFSTISKEQLLNIIEDVRENHIAKYYLERTVETNKDKVILGEGFTKPKSQRPIQGRNDWTKEEALEYNQNDWNHKANCWKMKWIDEKTNIPDYININVDLNDKWTISGSWEYEYVIFDLIHLLKIFDWNNDTLVAIGG